MKNWNYRHLNATDQKEICNWKYTGEYAIYNLPEYKIMKEKQIGFMNPASFKQYWGFYLENQLVGFVNIKEEEQEVFIGIGVRPDACDHQYGREILEITCKLASELFFQKPLYLEVRTWNKRAIRCYEHAGFRISGKPYLLKTSIGEGEFYRMVYYPGIKK